MAEKPDSKTDSNTEMLHRDVTFLRTSIVTSVKDGLNQAQINRNLKLSRRMSTYYFKGLQDSGFIRLKLRSVSNFYEITKKGKAFIDCNIPQGMKERIIEGCHDIYLKYPIVNTDSACNITKSFWNGKAWKLKNGWKRTRVIQKRDFQYPMTITLNQGAKTISVQLHEIEIDTVNKVNDMETVLFRVSWYLYRAFMQHEVVLDVERMSVIDNEFTYEDDSSRKAAGQDHRFTVPLGRDREKFTPNDPEQPAWVKICRTPNDNWESNDREHHRKRALMPETVSQMKKDLGALSPVLQELTEQLALHLKVESKTSDTMTNIDAGILALNEGVRNIRPGSEDKRQEIPVLEPTDENTVEIEIIKDMPDLTANFRGYRRHYRGLMMGARIYLEKQEALSLVYNGYARFISENKAMQGGE